jgi:hypothetical protein
MELTHFFSTHPFNIHLDQVSHPEAGSGTFLRNTVTNNVHYAMQKPKPISFKNAHSFYKYESSFSN